MSTLSDNLTARRELLGLNIPQVHAALTLRGVCVAESTVYSWFNGSRGVGKISHLKALCEVLQTDFNSLTDGILGKAAGSVAADIVRELAGLSEVQQQAILSTIKAMKAA
ncbi:hypothetical protein J7431_05780 [Xanthomonas phaseoli pv. dieffenbachiae]|uniref:hypothetical protein n=1 Tax=Xanthomonas TaxID=338 RepID=UPI0006E55B57|nr:MULTISPECIES: hypothetical protein [Xanthomonas]MBO9746795.1 hypothetical protein [Xanthomonas phaseoli pv. dieffenbachiae]MBO9753555.1 hypothetical protein [Xanthomonas phaseoli pv. dieffenbachiae]MBO9891681.1 hypothetical protein [Xanthomonas sp. D-36-1]OQP70530.1 hypothetical protein IB69_018330 [Xanthomonas citri]